MGLLTELLLVPLAPARIALWSVDQLIETATRQALDPAAIRLALADLSRRFDEGLVSAEEFEALEEQILDRLEEATTSLGNNQHPL
jgi:Gas vesicle protein G